MNSRVLFAVCCLTLSPTLVSAQGDDEQATPQVAGVPQPSHPSYKDFAQLSRQVEALSREVKSLRLLIGHIRADQAAQIAASRVRTQSQVVEQGFEGYSVFASYRSEQDAVDAVRRAAVKARTSTEIRNINGAWVVTFGPYESEGAARNVQEKVEPVLMAPARMRLPTGEVR